MSDIEFFAKLNPKTRTSFEEDFKVWREEFQEDEKQNTLKKAGKLNTESVEITYERFPEES